MILKSDIETTAEERRPSVKEERKGSWPFFCVATKVLDSPAFTKRSEIEARYTMAQEYWGLRLEATKVGDTSRMLTR